MRRLLLALLLLSACILQAQVVEVWKDGKVLYASPFVNAYLSATRIVRVDSLMNAPADGTFAYEQTYTVSGYNLMGVSSVSIGGEEVPFTATFSELSFTIPLGIASGDLVIEGITVTHVTLPELRISRVTPQSDVVAGTLIHIHGENLNYVQQLAYIVPGQEDTVALDYQVVSPEEITFSWPDVPELGYVMADMVTYWRKLYFNSVEPENYLLYEHDSSAAPTNEIIISDFDWAVFSGSENLILTIQYDLAEEVYYSYIQVYAYPTYSDLGWYTILPEDNNILTIEITPAQLKDIVYAGGIACNLGADITVQEIRVRERYTIPESSDWVIFSGSHDLGNWDNGLNFYDVDYAPLTVGSQIVIDFICDISRYGYAMLSIYSGLTATSWSDNPSFNEGDTSYTIPVDQALYDAITSSYGWGMVGCGLVITGIRIVQP